MRGQDDKRREEGTCSNKASRDICDGEGDAEAGAVRCRCVPCEGAKKGAIQIDCALIASSLGSPLIWSAEPL